MDELWLATGTALWLGLLTSINPCPLATNIAAISYIGQRVGSPLRVLLGGLLYTLGRVLAYVILAVILVKGLSEDHEVSAFLQRIMNKLLGPLFIVVGMVLLDLIRLPLRGRGVSEALRNRVDRWGLAGALLLGVVFALSFCPLSAALYFGSLIPLALKVDSGFLVPSVYGAGTALPVVAFAIIIAIGARSLGKAFERITEIDRWARRITGAVFIGLGLYFTLANIFRVLG